MVKGWLARVWIYFSLGKLIFLLQFLFLQYFIQPSPEPKNDVCRCFKIPSVVTSDLMYDSSTASTYQQHQLTYTVRYRGCSSLHASSNHLCDESLRAVHWPLSDLGSFCLCHFSPRLPTTSVHSAHPLTCLPPQLFLLCSYLYNFQL